MYRYDNYTDSFVRIDGEPNTGSTTVRVGVPLKEAVIIKKVELTDECIDKIADAVVRKLADHKTENSSEMPNNCKVKNYCDDCLYRDTCDSKELFYACTSKATISKMEQVDKPQYDFGEYADRLWKIAYERGKREALEQTEPSCDTCKLKDTTEWCKRQEVCRAYEPKDEPQTERRE